MSEQKLEISKKDLEEIAEMFYDKQRNLESEIAALNHVCSMWASDNPAFERLHADQIQIARLRPEISEIFERKYRDSLNRATDQLRQGSLGAAEFLRHLAGLGTRILRR